MTSVVRARRSVRRADDWATWSVKPTPPRNVKYSIGILLQTIILMDVPTPLNALFVAPLVLVPTAAGLIYGGGTLRQRHVRPGSCPTCGYSLRGATTHTCPECGNAI